MTKRNIKDKNAKKKDKMGSVMIPDVTTQAYDHLEISSSAYNMKKSDKKKQK